VCLSSLCRSGAERSYASLFRENFKAIKMKTILSLSHSFAHTHRSYYIKGYTIGARHWRNKLKWAPHPHYCGLGAGSIPFRAIVNKKQCETRGLFMSPVIHDLIGDVQGSQGVSASEMTYTVSLTHSHRRQNVLKRYGSKWRRRRNWGKMGLDNPLPIWLWEFGERLPEGPREADGDWIPAKIRFDAF